MYREPYYPCTTSTCTVLQCFVVPNKGQRMKLGAAKGEEFRVTPESMWSKNHMSCLEGVCLSASKSKL